MRDIVIAGAGGFAQEVLWLLNEITAQNKAWRMIGFISESPGDWNKKYNGYKVYKPSDVSAKHAALGFANTEGKKAFVQKYKQFSYPNLIHPNVLQTMNVKIGANGVVIFPTVTLMPCCEIKNFTYIHVNSVIGHDTVIGEYCSVSPSVSIMGNCSVGECSHIGVSTVTREKIKIGANCVTGAGSVIVSNIPDYSMAVGVPAKVIKTLKR